jgi:hypothetical protein
MKNSWKKNKLMSLGMVAFICFNFLFFNFFAIGSGSRRATSMWIRGDPDSKHCLLFLTKRFCVKIEEEELLRAELRKIEARKKEREKKTADLQKLIAQADSSAAEVGDLCFPSLCPFFLLTVSQGSILENWKEHKNPTGGKYMIFFPPVSLFFPHKTMQ